MFQDFKNSIGNRSFRISLFAAALLFASLTTFAVMRSASAASRPKPVVEQQTEVEFAPPPEEEIEEEELEEEEILPESAPARPRVVRPKMVAPTELSDEKLKESDAQLKEVKADGPTGGFLDGKIGGRGKKKKASPPPPPPPKVKKKKRAGGPIRMPEKAFPPKKVAGPRAPEYPRDARKQGVQGVVIVRLLIDEKGKITRFEIARGPKIFHETVRAWIRLLRYTPAKLPDGTPFATIKTIKVPFRLTNL